MKDQHFSTFIILLLLICLVTVGVTVYHHSPSSLPVVSNASVPSYATQLAQVSSSGTSCSVVCSGLVGYWPFDDGSGTTAVDASGNGHNGTLTGGPTWTSGKVGSGALSFSGTGQSVSVGNVYDAPGAFTMSAWIDPASLNSTQSFLGKFTGGKGYRLDLVKSSGSWHAVLEMDGSSFTGTTNIQAGTWYLVTAVYDGTTASLYIDSSVDASGASAAPSSNSASFLIGSGNDGPYVGTMDDVRMYSRALSAGEVATLSGGASVPAAPAAPSVPVAPTAPALPAAAPTTPTVPAAAPVISGPSVNAASCSQTDVQSAVDSAVAGDRVNIPAGTCTWTATVVVANKPITIAGAGAGVTTIIDNVPKNAQDGPAAGRITPYLFLIHTLDNGVTRLTGMTLNGGTGIKDPYNSGLVRLDGTSKTWRIDHMSFVLTRTSGVEIYDWTYGVVDHNYFDESVGGYGVYVFDNAWNNGVYGDGSWADSLHLGTGQAVFLEDNTFYASSVGNHAATDGWSGERIVIRYNTLINTNISFHGTESSHNYRGARSFEIYDNTLQYTGLETNGVEIRSGNGVIFGNNLTGTLNQAFNPSVYREFAPFPPWGQCDGTSPFDVNGGVTYDSGTATAPSGFGADKTQIVLTSSRKTWTPNQWVGYSVHDPSTNTSGVIISNTADTLTTNGSFTFGDGTNYIFTINQGDPFTITRASVCLDQPGRGQGTLFVRDPSSGAPVSPAWPNEIQEPIYAWNNTLNGVAGAATIVSHSPHIVEGRDFFNGYSMPGYTPYTYPHPLVQAEDGVPPIPVSINATVSPPAPLVIPPANPVNPLTPQTPTPTPVIPTATSSTVTPQLTPTLQASTTGPIPEPLLDIPLYTRSPSVTLLQNDLISLGYLGIGLNTGYFGPLTESAVNRYLGGEALPTLATPAVSTPAISTTGTGPNLAGLPSFTRTLSLGSAGSDVKNLQIFLNDYGFSVAQSGNGSKGHETSYFGPATKAALIRFQDVYAAEILKPEGLTEGTGYFGSATKSFVNALQK